jgi:hypothetical protein
MEDKAPDTEGMRMRERRVGRVLLGRGGIIVGGGVVVMLLVWLTCITVPKEGEERNYVS